MENNETSHHQWEKGIILLMNLEVGDGRTSLSKKYR